MASSLAARSSASAGPRPISRRFGGADRLVADYVRDEILAALPPDARGVPRADARCSRSLRRRRATRCSAAPAPRAILAELAAAGLLVPLDRTDERFRHHRLIGAALRAELRRTSPAAEPELHAGRGAWHRRAGDIDHAVHHALLAGDVRGAGDLVWSSSPPPSPRAGSRRSSAGSPASRTSRSRRIPASRVAAAGGELDARARAISSALGLGRGRRAVGGAGRRHGRRAGARGPARGGRRGRAAPDARGRRAGVSRAAGGRPVALAVLPRSPARPRHARRRARRPRASRRARAAPRCPRRTSTPSASRSSPSLAADARRLGGRGGARHARARPGRPARPRALRDGGARVRRLGPGARPSRVASTRRGSDLQEAIRLQAALTDFAPCHEADVRILARPRRAAAQRPRRRPRAPRAGGPHPRPRAGGDRPPARGGGRASASSTASPRRAAPRRPR